MISMATKEGKLSLAGYITQLQHVMDAVDVTNDRVSLSANFFTITLCLFLYFYLEAL